MESSIFINKKEKNLGLVQLCLEKWKCQKMEVWDGEWYQRY